MGGWQNGGWDVFSFASNPPTIASGAGSAFTAGVYYMPPPSGADDGPTLQAVLNAYALKPNPSVRLIYQAGTFQFSTTVTVPRVGATNRCVSVVIEGVGYMQDGFFQTNPDGTIWLAKNLAGDLLTTNTTGNTFSFVSLEKLTISANPTMGGSQTAGHLVHLWALQEGTLRDVEVEYAFADGIRIEAISGSINCDILSLDHCRVEHCGGNGIALLGEIQGLIHGGTHVEQCNVGVSLGSTSDQTGMIGCTIQACTLQGLLASNRDGQFIGNFVTQSGHEGMQFLNATRPIVGLNHCNDNGSANIDPRGIRLFNTTGAKIQGNICTDTGTGYQRHGFSEEGTSNNNDVSGNDFSGNVTAAVNSVVGAATVLKNNTGYNPVGVVVVAVPASTVAVAAAPYDRTFYIATAAGATTIAIQGGPTITLQASTAGQSVRVPAAKTMTPTFAGAPTWVVEGE